MGESLLQPGLGRATWIVAHRGDSARAPENTLEAAERALEGGSDAWELDVQLSRDGIPVVIHDDTLTRTTDVASRFPRDPRGSAGYLVAEFELGELQSLDAGSWFVASPGAPRSAADFGSLASLDRGALDRFASGRVRVPTLVEALRWTVARDWLVNVELKAVPLQPPGLVEAVLAAIDTAGAAGHVWLSSFDHELVARVAGLRPELPAGALTVTPLHRPAAYVRRHLGASAYHPSAAAIGAESLAFRRAAAPEGLRTGDLAGLHREGVPVFVFTVNGVGPGGMADVLAAAGVRGVFTDRPSELASRWGGPPARVSPAGGGR